MSEMLQKSVNLEPEAITKRDVSLAWLRFYFANEIPHSFDIYCTVSDVGADANSEKAV